MTSPESDGSKTEHQPSEPLSLKERLERGTDAAKFSVTSGLVITFVLAGLVDVDLGLFGAFFSVVPVGISGVATLIGLSRLSFDFGTSVAEEQVQILSRSGHFANQLLGVSLGFAAFFLCLRMFGIVS